MSEFQPNFLKSKEFYDYIRSERAVESYSYCGTKKGGKTVEVEKIMLMSETGKITVETLTDAEKMAKKKGFRLAEVKELESKFHTDKKVYKFETLEEHFKEEWGKSGEN